MREILFKAKRLDTDEWIEGYYFQRLNDPTGEKHYIVTVGKCQWYEINPDTLCEFTGLTDRDGNKIWENDIIDVSDCCFITNSLVIFRPNPNTYSLVRYNPILTGFYPFIVNDVDGMFLFDAKKVKTISNKFDNPELLEGENK